MRKILFLGACVLACVGGLRAQTAVTPSPNPAFQFDGTTFVRAAVTPTKTGTMEEYLPAGQAPAHWTRMAAIHHLTTAVPDPIAATRDLADAVKRRNPDAQVLLMNNAATGDALVDFVTWPTGSSTPAYLEYDICRYRKAPEGGLIAFQLVRRAYGNDEQALLQNLKAERQRLIPLMGAAQFGPK